MPPQASVMPSANRAKASRSATSSAWAAAWPLRPVISSGGTANYTASKAGLLGLTRHAAYELAPDGIRVNAVCPGPTATGFGGAVPTDESKAARSRKIPLGRMCEPEDIADPILFLAGDAARMITGVALNVDGGVLVKNDTPYEEYFRRR